jgi:hypothetical protein
MKVKRITTVILFVSIFIIVLKCYGFKMLGIEKFVHKKQSCVEYSNGGGAMIITYETFEFAKNDVLYYTEDSEHLNNGYRKSFKYTKKGDYIYIKIDKEDFMLSGLDTLRISGDTLIAHNVIKFIKQ